MHGVIPRVNFDEILNIAALPFEKLVPYLKFGNNLGLQGFRSPSWWMSEKKKKKHIHLPLLLFQNPTSIL